MRRYWEGKAAADRVAELEALAEQGPMTEAQETELAELRPKAQQKQKRKQKQKEGDAKRYREGKAAADRVAELEALAERGPLTEEQVAELAELRPKAQKWQKKKEGYAERRRAIKAAADRVAELEELAERGPLSEEQVAELVALRPKAQQQQKINESAVKHRRAEKAAADRVAELEALAERVPLSEEQVAELAELRPKVALQKQKKNDRYRTRRAAADRVAELEALAERVPLSEEQVAELAELRPKVAQQKQKKNDQYRTGKAAADRVAELEALAERVPLTEEQVAELAELRPKAQQWQKQKERSADRARARNDAADRVAVLEALADRGPLSAEQVAELAELRPKVAQQKQKKKEIEAKYRQGLKAAADRVAVLEALAERGPLTEEQTAELAALRSKAQQWQKKKEENADRYWAMKAAADRVAVLEGLKEQGWLTVEQVAELAELRPKAQQWQKKKEEDAKYRRVRMAAAARVAELEELKEQGPLTVEQEVELAELQPKVVQQKQKQKERDAGRYWAGRAAAARVAELEGLEGLTGEQGVELAELRPKAQLWQKRKERFADRYWAMKAAAARVVELEGLEGLTGEQGVELAELRSKVAGRGRKKKDRDVTETGVGGPVIGRGVGPDEMSAPEGMSGWTGADQVDWDAWSADVDLDAWLDQAVADVDRAQVPQGAADAGVMLGEGAYGEFVANELLAFLGQDADDDAAGVGGVGSVAGGFDFAGFLSDYSDGEGSVGLFGVEGADGLFFGEPFAEDAVGLLRGMRWGLGCGGCRSGSGGESVGSGYRFLSGVNQANYGSGDERFRVNCLEAVVAFHNSLKFGRQFVAGPAGGDRDPARLEAAFGATAQRVDGVAGAEQYVRSGRVGVAVPVIYQRADGSAHVIAAVHAGDGDGVDLLDPQKGRSPKPLMFWLRPGCG